MLARSRKGTSPDTGRIGEMLARPGLDTRVWVSLATVRAVHVESGGKFCDVTLLPSGDEETVRVGDEYAGNGFGDHNPLHVDDEVVVLFPGGAPDAGGVIVARLHNSSDAVPSDAVINVNDRQIVVESGKNLRMTTQGSGDVLVTSGSDVDVDASAKVKLSAGTSLNATAGTSAKLEAALAATVKGGTTATVEGTTSAIMKALTAMFKATPDGKIALGTAAVELVAQVVALCDVMINNKDDFVYLDPGPPPKYKLQTAVVNALNLAPNGVKVLLNTIKGTLP